MTQSQLSSFPVKVVCMRIVESLNKADSFSGKVFQVEWNYKNLYSQQISTNYELNY